MKKQFIIRNSAPEPKSTSTPDQKKPNFLVLLKNLLVSLFAVIAAIFAGVGKAGLFIIKKLSECVRKHSTVATVLILMIMCAVVLLSNAYLREISNSDDEPAMSTIKTDSNPPESTPDDPNSMPDDSSNVSPETADTTIAYEYDSRGYLIPNKANQALYKAATSTNDKKRLYGIDISYYQRDTMSQNIQFADDFVVCRVSAGKNVDKIADKIYQASIAEGKLLGVYFYVTKSQWEANDAREHARWCADQCKNYIGWALFALDIEYDSNIVDTKWSKEWLDEFKAYTGVTPMLYINAETEKGNDWSNIASDYPLWVADYRTDGYTLKYWEKATMHQYTSTDNTLDQDSFYGSAADWWKLTEVHEN